MYIAAWLQVPGRNISLYALDLSFNRIQAPSGEAFAPLLEWLRPYVLHMDFAGNYLPTIIELDLLISYNSACLPAGFFGSCNRTAYTKRMGQQVDHAS